MEDKCTTKRKEYLGVLRVSQEAKQCLPTKHRVLPSVWWVMPVSNWIQVKNLSVSGPKIWHND